MMKKKILMIKNFQSYRIIRKVKMKSQYNIKNLYLKKR